MAMETKADNGPVRPPAAPRGWIRSAWSAGSGVPAQIKKKVRGGYRTLGGLKVPQQTNNVSCKMRWTLWGRIAARRTGRASPSKSVGGMKKDWNAAGAVAPPLCLFCPIWPALGA